MYIIVQKMFTVAIILSFSALKFSYVSSTDVLRVIKGFKDVHNQYAYICSLHKGHYLNQNKPVVKSHCTGSFISKDWVLTAAHCMFTKFVRTDKRKMTRTKDEAKYYDYSKVLKEFKHENYYTKRSFHPLRPVTWKVGNDISLLKVTEFRMKNYVKVLAVDYLTLIGLRVMYAGYGRTSVSKKKKKQVYQSLMLGNAAVSKCPNTTRYPVICIAPECSNRKAHPYFGDSGGPLLYAGRIIGVLSGGKDPKKYTAVSQYLDWIADVIERNKD